MPTLVFDTETTTLLKGHPFHPGNRMVASGFMLDGDYIETMDKAVIANLFSKATVIVGFNIKFDLHWIRRTFDIVVTDKQVWDCQLAHFLITNQSERFPSLNSACAYNGMEQKLDVVKTEYWDVGIDTPDIPASVLSEYLKQDVVLTWDLYQAQKIHSKHKLIHLSCLDTLVLAEMEWNGMQYDCAASQAEGDRLQVEIDDIDRQLNEIVGFQPNWNSRDQLSAILFGGEIKTERKEDYLFSYADKKKAPVVKTRTVIDTIVMPTLCKPSAETSKPGVYVVDSGTLGRIKTRGKAAKIIELILHRAKMNKLVGTYLHGLPALAAEKGWGNVIHGQLNQCTAVTSRLSSDSPNLQNVAPGVKQFFVSRFTN